MKAADNEAEKKSEIVQRVQQMLTHYGLNASSATQKLGYSTTSKLYNILKGSEPSYPTLVDFLRQWPDLSPEWLMLGQGPMLRGAGAEAGTMVPRPSSVGGQPAINGGGVLVVTVDGEGANNVELVPVSAQAGYAAQHKDASFVQSLPRYRLPQFEGGQFRAFEVSGDSMTPTLNHNDIVVCSYVDNWRLLIPDDIYVVVTAESVMLKRIHRRINDRTAEVMLYSDNHYRRPYPLDASDITELWRVRGYLSTLLPSAPDVTVERLWEVIGALGLDKSMVRRHLEEGATSDATL